MATSPLPLVDPFAQAYEAWEERNPTLEEMLAQGSTDSIRVKLIARVTDVAAAAGYIVRVRQDNGLGGHIESALVGSDAYRAWQAAMPARTPPALSCYQRNYDKCDLSAVSAEIGRHGALLSSGQSLFHGGRWQGGASYATTRPLSTSLCPQVALRNAEWGAKAYDAGQIDLIVLRASSPATRAYVYKRKGTALGHEHEVLLGAGATLTLQKQTLVDADYPVAKYGHPNKNIPVYVVEAEFS